MVASFADLPTLADSASTANTLANPVNSTGPSNQQSAALEDLITTFNRRSRRPWISRGELCIIAPGLLEDVYVVWGDRPLFLWQGQVNQVVVRDDQGREVWRQAVAPTEQSVLYGGAPLLPGQLYEWQLNPVGSQEVDQSDQFYTFRIMPTDQRNKITADLQTLSRQLQAERATPETIVLRQAQYFVDKGLWSDALRTLYEVQNPSPALTQMRQTIIRDYCDRQSS